MSTDLTTYSDSLNSVMVHPHIYMYLDANIRKSDLKQRFSRVVYYCFVIPFLPTLFHVFLVFSPVLLLKKLKKVLHYFSPPKNLSLFLYL